MTAPHPRVLAGDAKVERARLMRKARHYRTLAYSAKGVRMTLYWFRMCRQFIVLARRQNRIVAFWMAESHKRGVP